MTIHKSQGSTLGKIVLNVSEKEYSCGLLYVGVSRVEKFEDLVMNTFTFERLKMIGIGESFNKRKKEWGRLMLLSRKK